MKRIPKSQTPIPKTKVTPAPQVIDYPLPAEIRSLADLVDAWMTTTLKLRQAPHHTQAQEAVRRRDDLVQAVNRRWARYRPPGGAPAAEVIEEGFKLVLERRVFYQRWAEWVSRATAQLGSGVAVTLDDLAEGVAGCWDEQEVIFDPKTTPERRHAAAQAAHQHNKNRCEAMRRLDTLAGERPGVLAKTFAEPAAR